MSDAENVPRLAIGFAGANGDGSTPIKKSWEVRKGKDVKNKVLVAGASRLVGAAAIESFPAPGWDVTGISRRKPELPSGRDFRSRSYSLNVALGSLADVAVRLPQVCFPPKEDMVDRSSASTFSRR